MKKTTTGFLLSVASWLVALVVTRSVYGCERCGIPSQVPCVCHSFVDSFRDGGGDEPEAFRTVGSGWSTTSGGFSPVGEPALVTWSIVPDQTIMPQGQGEPVSPSNLIAFLDGIHHGGPGPGGTDLTQRAWFPLIKSAFDRWDAVSGLRFSYEPQDDGVVNGFPVATLGSYPGSLGVRGDHRIGGHSIDGSVSPTIVAYNYFPNNSDMVLDTDEVGRFGNSSGNYLRFRNTIMHEIGHGLGLNHVSSAGHNFLMEAFLDTSFDGPQFDDILGVHSLYGDRFEENGGNDSPTTATNLGSFVVGQSITLGKDAVDAAVGPTDIDFVSINKFADTDYFRFSVSGPTQVNISVTPLGPTYPEGSQSSNEMTLNTSARNDLGLYFYNGTGSSLLGYSNSGGLGDPESLMNFPIYTAGDYLIRVVGTYSDAQFYQLDLSVVPEPTAAILLLVGLAGWTTRRERSS